MHVYVRPRERYLACLVCEGVVFARREVKLTTSGMTFMGLDWLNRSADGAVCVECGFVHQFLGDGHQWVDPARLRPGEGPTAPTRAD